MKLVCAVLLSLIVPLVARMAIAQSNIPRDQGAVTVPPSSHSLPNLPRHAPPIAEGVRNLLEPYGLVPILVSWGERVGDVLHPRRLVLMAGADECFPGLQPRRTPVQLPSVAGGNARSLAAALGAPGIAEANISQAGVASFELAFSDVEATVASIHQLRTTLKRNIPECEGLRSALEAFSSSELTQSKSGPARSRAISNNVEPPILIGALYRARRIVRITMQDKIDASANISVGERILRLFGARRSFDIKASRFSNEANTIELIGQQVVPVAFSQAFITRHFAGRKILEAIDPDSPEFASNTEASFRIAFSAPETLLAGATDRVVAIQQVRVASLLLQYARQSLREMNLHEAEHFIASARISLSRNLQSTSIVKLERASATQSTFHKIFVASNQLTHAETALRRQKFLVADRAIDDAIGSLREVSSAGQVDVMVRWP